ncbi:hypothetical protein MMC24_006652 [Lignoscripta atroalba]|nr:hypothetical protein [Lignoscripta atroalba]
MIKPSSLTRTAKIISQTSLTSINRAQSSPFSKRQFSAAAIRKSTVSETIIHDHKELDEYINNILSAKDDDTKVRWQNQLTWELARHSIAEELVVYPAMEKNLPGGKSMADKDREQHQTLKEVLYKFQGLKPSDTDFEPTLKELMANLDEHTKQEEKDDLPILENAIEKSESESLAKSFGRTKMFIPTRSHPSAPDRPPFETVAGLMTAPLDRLGDMFRKFPKDN